MKPRSPYSLRPIDQILQYHNNLIHIETIPRISNINLLLDNYILYLRYNQEMLVMALGYHEGDRYRLKVAFVLRRGVVESRVGLAGNPS